MTIFYALFILGISMSQQALFDAFETLEAKSREGKITKDQYLGERNILVLSFRDMQKADTLLEYHKVTMAMCAKNKSVKEELDTFRIMGLIYDSRREYEFADNFVQKGIVTCRESPI